MAARGLWAPMMLLALGLLFPSATDAGQLAHLALGQKDIVVATDAPRALQSEVTGTITTDGTAVTKTVSTPGDKITLTFTELPGSYVSLQTSGNFYPYTKVSILDWDGTPRTWTNIGGFIDKTRLDPLAPVGSTYKITLVPRSDAPTGTATFRLWDVPPDDPGEIAIDGPAETMTISRPGQNAYRTFWGDEGDVIFTTIGTGFYEYAKVYLIDADAPPNTPALQAVNFGQTYIDRFVLTHDSHYRIYLDPTGSSASQTGSAAFRIYSVPPDDTSTLAIGGDSQQMTVSSRGQRSERLFQGFKGQTVSLSISNVPGIWYYTRIGIFDPDGVPLASRNLTGGGVLALPLFTKTGTYKVWLDPPGASTGSITVRLTGTPGGSVAISGLANVGQTLAASANFSSPPATSWEYQWQRCNAAGASCSELFGQTGPTYPVEQADVGSTLRVVVKGTNVNGSTTLTSPQTRVVLGPIPSLLASFEPELHYAQNDGYRADSAAAITNSHSVSLGVYSNYLIEQNGIGILAASDPTVPPRSPDSDPPALLTQDFLRPGTYPSGVAVNSGDFLDEHNETESADAQYMHTHGYADVVYSRYLQTPSGDAYLQYWFFYYYNPKEFSVLGLGEHEGDWEMVQYHLGSSSSLPQWATYSQHHGGETCAWSGVPKTASGRPIAYVAEGSHANYFWSGTHDIYKGPLTFHDYTNELGDQYVPQNLENVSDPPQWMRWPGSWGASNGAAASPTSPTLHSQWDDPATYEASAAPCTSPSSPRALLELKSGKSSNTRAGGRLTGTASGPLPPFPKVSIRRSGSKLIVRYCFSSVPTSRAQRPFQIITAVDSTRRDRMPPFTLRSRVTLPCGRVVSPLGYAKGPLVLRVAVMGKTGAETPSRTYRVPN
jgi:hypothetical protein